MKTCRYRKLWFELRDEIAARMMRLAGIRYAREREGQSTMVQECKLDALQSTRDRMVALAETSIRVARVKRYAAKKRDQKRRSR